MAVIYLLSFLFLIGFEFFVFRPLRQITEAATQYASGNLTYEIPVTTHDEMGYLSASLNYMSSQLKDMEEYQKKIVANVSHDFRSPLTSIKGYVQAMTDGTIPPQLHQKYLNIILFETERLTDLTQDLLTLNEFDRNEMILDKTEFDIQQMTRTLPPLSKAPAQANGFPLSFCFWQAIFSCMQTDGRFSRFFTISSIMRQIQRKRLFDHD